MTIHLTYWYLLPLSAAIATMAMLTGVGGAKFFTPFFLVVLRLESHVAFAVALLTQSFGFLSGLVAYSTRRSIDYGAALSLLAVTIPASLLMVAICRRFTWSDSSPRS